jgi:hypothetical protein
MLRQVVIVFLTATLIAASGCGSNSAVQQPPRCVSGAVAEILKGYFGPQCEFRRQQQHSLQPGARAHVQQHERS